MKRAALIATVATVLISAGCAIQTPEVTFSSERTALEKQILGSYRTIEEDAWMITATRSPGGSEIPVLESRRQAVEAFAQRKFNADDVEDFKRDEVAGENAQGFLTIRPTERYQADSDYRALVDRVVAEENRDRSIIMTHIVEANTAVNPLDPQAVARVFAQMNQDASPEGTWIQKADSSWTRK